MATSLVGPYDVWLTETLTAASADIDTDVFVSYIIGILDDDTPEEDKKEGITELLSGVVEPDAASQLYESIVAKWAEQNESRTTPESADKGDQLSTFLGQQTLATVKEKKLTKEEAERKAAILAQYAQVSDGEESEDEGDDSDGSPATGGGGGGKGRGETQDSLLMRNVNKEEVARAEKDLREKAREEVEKKKEKDKQDRAAQKQKQQERKDTEKKRTQKGEKRR
ncbi:coiled-coil domain-containing protein 43 [Aplysia californica]|uniref:Coiled-coil domain-containing protein 43 n=1 Tax=Aplysia californica TaxID=6500 RepID=A0ABM1A4K3_APLCA|nr:coiled-coil domain-containing protein 43 [Aplysia californica]